MDAAAELLLGEQRKPAFDQIDPGRALRGEVQMIAGRFASHRWTKAVLWVA
jgi:hypothetical protein